MQCRPTYNAVFTWDARLEAEAAGRRLGIGWASRFSIIVSRFSITVSRLEDYVITPKRFRQQSAGCCMHPHA